MQNQASRVFIALFISLSVCSLLLSCATTKSKLEEPDAKTQQKIVGARENVKANVKLEKTQQTLDEILKTQPKGKAALESHIILGDLFYQKKEFESAHSHYQSALEIAQGDPRQSACQVMAARALVQLKKLDQALAVLQPALDDSDLETRLSAQKVRYMIALYKIQPLLALQALVVLSQDSPSAPEREANKQKAIEIVEGQLSRDQLREIVDSSSNSEIHGYAYLRLGKLSYDSGDLSTARTLLSSAESRLPQGPAADRAKELLNQMESRYRVQSKTIGCVLPLTGKLSKIGLRTLQGIQLGLGIYGSKKGEFSLAIIDSEGNPDLARRGVQKLVENDHVIAIIGSLLSKTAVAVASKAQEYGIPSIALSQKAGLTELGPFVFRNALTSEMQVRKLVETVMTKKKWRNFAILFPNDAYGVEYANLFWDSVLVGGGQVTAVQTYDPNETDFSDTVRRLVGTYYLEDRSEEYKARLNAWLAGQKTRGDRSEPPEDLLPPIADFDAIFIPDSAKALGQIAPMLAYNDVSNAPLIGTNLWNTQDIFKRAGKYAENTLFVDAAPPSPKTSAAFIAEFEKVFGTNPDVFEVQGYDSALILRTLISDGASSREELRGRLSRLTDFPGALGPLSMSPFREISRPVLPMSVHQGNTTPIQ